MRQHREKDLERARPILLAGGATNIELKSGDIIFTYDNDHFVLNNSSILSFKEAMQQSSILAY